MTLDIKAAFDSVDRAILEDTAGHWAGVFVASCSVSLLLFTTVSELDKDSLLGFRQLLTSNKGKAFLHPPSSALHWILPGGP